MISNKCSYALKATLELAKREGQGPVTIGDIAAAQSIPSRFLEAILRELKQAGYTDSIRGKDGGYVLAKPARELTVGSIVRLVEGPLMAAAENTSLQPNVFLELWERAEGSLADVLDAMDFQSLADRDTELQANVVANYSI